ncbi:hypothetical protein ANN_25018 [Periplaneta americana]|uniref:Uncharacterized protein n=1 Tax=Periplaneta americana TaxID=6978 RepID=A0ABQ8S0E8_PERAM|nr:hypothetical protein ANN_25018 [Periplaneta americana]
MVERSKVELRVTSGCSEASIQTVYAEVSEKRSSRIRLMDKNSTKHTTMRVLLFQIIAPGISLPPQPVLTRWGTWLDAVNYYAEHYGKIMEVIDALDSTDSSAVAAVKSLPSEQLLEDILFIDSNFKIVPKSITLLESSKLQLSEALNIVDKVSQTVIQNNNSLILEKVKCKLRNIIAKNSSYSQLRIINDVPLGHDKTSEVGVLKNYDFPFFKYAPITSCDVELIEHPADCEMQSVIRFLNARNIKPVDIHRQLCEAYGNDAISDGMVRKLVRKFNEGRISVHDEQHTGRPSLINDDLCTGSNLKHEGIVTQHLLILGRGKLRKNQNQVTCPDRDPNPGHLVSRSDAVTPALVFVNRRMRRARCEARIAQIRTIREMRAMTHFELNTQYLTSSKTISIKNKKERKDFKISELYYFEMDKGSADMNALDRSRISSLSMRMPCICYEKIHKRLGKTREFYLKQEGDRGVQKKSFALVSDYVAHDIYAVDVCLWKVFSEISAILPNTEVVKIFSDGAASYFKQMYTLRNVTLLTRIFGFNIEWNFFQSYHGKGAVDSIRGQVKRMAWMAAKSGKKIQSATEIYNIVSNKNIQIIVQKVALIEIDVGNKYIEKRFGNLAPIPPTHGVHYVKLLDPYVIDYAQLSCEQAVRKIHRFRV